ncbi:transmembrane protein [Perilla frutescens var. hirtella]|uniref:Transmembrane protein n=1 Tax=Perilla frutescens var. hirtella TaxID=608512 RepID=A0AAD4P7L4_PERFH|nr:transmembrane protein [Perilla frutescens var. hirtella]KAH6818024.1 transmembrane protein [Perilla frutescens var. frutescens]KAH6829868.1 transmembrane protein [Perilla frutescens var. hirtella]
MQFSKSVVLEVEPPSVVRYLIGAAIMMLGVVLPVGYMMFRNKRVPSSSSYSKQT